MFEKTLQPIKLNNGETKDFLFFDREDLAVEMAEYVHKMKKKLGRKTDFTSRELLTAPWMPTQSEVLHKAGYCSLEQLARRAAGY